VSVVRPPLDRVYDKIIDPFWPDDGLQKETAEFSRLPFAEHLPCRPGHATQLTRVRGQPDDELGKRVALADRPPVRIALTRGDGD